MVLSDLGALGAIVVGLLVVLGDQRRFFLLGFASHYLAVMALVVPILGLEIALAKVVAGFIASGILWFSTREQADLSGSLKLDLIDRPIFRGALLALVLIAGWGVGRAAWLDIPGLSSAAEIGATMLLALGLMVAAFFDEPLRMGLGIMIGVSGFEVVYAAVEPSLAILALLAGIQLSLALVVSYLAQFRSSHQEGEA